MEQVQEEVSEQVEDVNVGTEEVQAKGEAEEQVNDEIDK